MSQKTLVVDGQIFQTDARDRGMGRYSTRLISSLIDASNYKDVKLILTRKSQANKLHDDVAQKLFNGAEVVYLDLLNTEKVKLETATNNNKKVIEAYIAKLTNDPANIDYLIPSLFQEPVVSIFPDEVKKILVFYDLIPYLYHRRYERVMQFENYLKRFKALMAADVILSISQAVKDDLVMYLGLPKERIKVVDGAAIVSPYPAEKPGHITLPPKFILMPTSDDPRKNNLKAVLGFEEFRASQGSDFKLVITSKIHRNEQERLSLFSQNLIFTGNLRDQELDWLYKECEIVLFVPESEGLGLPILEAVEAHKRVVCSSINVFKEISNDAFYFCNHEDQHSIAAALESALLHKKRDSFTEKKYKTITDHYNWPKTGERSFDAITDTSVRHSKNACPRLAILAPSPDGLSAVGKVVAESHPILNEYFEIDYYLEKGNGDARTRPNYLPYIANCFDAESFGVDAYSRYDGVLYHIGNSDYHQYSILNSLYLPGIAIMHDTNIPEAFRILRETGKISPQREELEALITKKIKKDTSNSISSVINNQLAILTHSKYAMRASKDVLVDSDGLTPVKPIQLASPVPDVVNQRDYETLTIGLAGIIADIKGVEVIERLAKEAQFNDCNLKMFGYNFAPQETIERLTSYHNVSVTTDLTDFEFQNSVGKLDVFVNYRIKYQGETSLSTIEAMRRGVVVIVRDFGWYSELPDSVVIKVNSPDEVVEVLRELRNDPDKLRDISLRAQTYIMRQHSHEQYAEGIQDILSEIANNNGRKNLVAKSIRAGEVKTSSALSEIEESEM